LFFIVSLPINPAHNANLLFFQNYLDSYVESVDSTYGCVLLHGRIVCATKNWFLLHPDEVNLLSTYVTSDSWATIKDTPVFLPVKSPTVRRVFIIYICPNQLL
jgi:hypothetical protein